MARTEGQWIKTIAGYIKIAGSNGANLLINGANRYINFDLISGASGYGIRDNAGVLEFKNDGGIWSTFGGGGGGGITTEQAVDAVMAQVAAGTHTGITVTYDDAGNTISYALSDEVFTTALLNKLNDAEVTTNKDAVNGYAGLDASGKINPTQLPAIAVVSTYPVASEVAQLALTVQEGDIAVRTDINKSFIALNASNASMADWQELLTPTDQVQSVFGRSGVVTAQNGDYDTDQVTEATNLYFTTARVRSTTLAGLSLASSSVILAADTVLVAFGKLQAQITSNASSISTNTSDISTNTSNIATKLSNVVEDTTPQLGGFLDINGKLIGDATAQYDNGNVTGAVTINTNNHRNQKLTLTGNATLSFTAPTGLNDCHLQLTIIQDGTGGHVPTFPAASLWKWANTEPDWATMTASQECVISMYWDGTKYVVMAGDFY